MLPEINMTPKDREFITPVSHPDVSVEANLILLPHVTDPPPAQEQGAGLLHPLPPQSRRPLPAQLRPGCSGRRSHPNLSGISQSRFNSWLLPLPFLMTLSRPLTFSEPPFLHH